MMSRDFKLTHASQKMQPPSEQEENACHVMIEKMKCLQTQYLLTQAQYPGFLLQRRKKTD